MKRLHYYLMNKSIESKRFAWTIIIAPWLPIAIISTLFGQIFYNETVAILLGLIGALVIIIHNCYIFLEMEINNILKLPPNTRIEIGRGSRPSCYWDEFYYKVFVDNQKVGSGASMNKTYVYNDAVNEAIKFDRKRRIEQSPQLESTVIIRGGEAKKLYNQEYVERLEREVGILPHQ